ncbi:hypothetical protein HYH03_013297 [Edaphochlamys debaryana]|uniref:Uncharacterized protein n=1 Tax=Edaphochlamys debaryana TaxID=47281 RepID=A0A836BUP4_9CHLO|nr:hypothetical protein HYH03_013297 [Edaphochlamys debaryana]|eukprot:KAG2488154.1 hypothetical protein HYH03_013297 [Edaphochlamys debaryana]
MFGVASTARKAAAAAAAGSVVRLLLRKVHTQQLPCNSCFAFSVRLPAAQEQPADLANAATPPLDVWLLEGDHFASAWGHREAAEQLEFLPEAASLRLVAATRAAVLEALQPLLSGSGLVAEWVEGRHLNDPYEYWGTLWGGNLRPGGDPGVRDPGPSSRPSKPFLTPSVSACREGHMSTSAIVPTGTLRPASGLSSAWAPAEEAWRAAAGPAAEGAVQLMLRRLYTVNESYLVFKQEEESLIGPGRTPDLHPWLLLGVEGSSSTESAPSQRPAPAFSMTYTK